MITLEQLEQAIVDAAAHGNIVDRARALEAAVRALLALARERKERP